MVSAEPVMAFDVDKASKTEIKAYVVKMQRRVQELQHLVADLQDQLAHQASAGSEAASQLREREEAIQTRERALQEAEQRLREREAALLERERAASENATAPDELLHLREREAQLAEWEERLRLKEQELQRQEQAQHLSQERTPTQPRKPIPPPKQLPDLLGPLPWQATQLNIRLPARLKVLAHSALTAFRHGASSDTYVPALKDWVYWTLLVRAGLLVLLTEPRLNSLGKYLTEFTAQEAEEVSRRILIEHMQRLFGWDSDVVQKATSLSREKGPAS